MIRLLAILIMLFYSFSVMVASAKSHFSSEETEEIGKIATEYIVKHPDFLIQASKNLQVQQAQKQKDAYVNKLTGTKKAKKDVQNKLLHDNKTPYVGPENAKIAVIEFFDYQCVFCSKVAPAIEQLIKDNPSVKFIFKDYAIFGSQWVPSDYAANISSIAFQQGGSKLYHKYHNEIFNTGKDEGKLTVQDINEIVKKLKIKLGKNALADKSKEKAKLLYSIEENMEFGNSLDIMGTPFIIVMPVDNPNKDNITVFPGYPADPQKGVLAAVKVIQKAINKAQKSITNEDEDKNHNNDK